MFGFCKVVEALQRGEHVRRQDWFAGAKMYADDNGQIRGITSFGGEVSMDLDMSDYTASDWGIA